MLSLGEETKHFHFHLFPRYNWMLNFPEENICTNGKIDGAKLFSFSRNKYKTNKQEQYESRFLSVINHVREKTG
ncbi:diadenosine tetraphosphate (Ap4A) HIT family hydrolase [Sporomusaceae bacterium BoRhaA]|nr:diadenosine tetraphosphate (Ap4A) HIT family hydrolase [Pelorhabdus rhamnosifermentans]